MRLPIKSKNLIFETSLYVLPSLSSIVFKVPKSLDCLNTTFFPELSTERIVPGSILELSTSARSTNFKSVNFLFIWFLSTNLLEEFASGGINCLILFRSLDICVWFPIIFEILVLSTAVIYLLFLPSAKSSVVKPLKSLIPPPLPEVVIVSNVTSPVDVSIEFTFANISFVSYTNWSTLISLILDTKSV